MSGSGAAIEPGQTTTMRIDQPRAAAYLFFTATAGQTAAVAVTGSGLGNTCSEPRIIAPDGTSLGSGCVIEGEGKVDPTRLPAAGRYVLVWVPTGRTTGSAQVRLTLTG